MTVKCIEVVQVRLQEVEESVIVEAHAKSTRGIQSAHPGLVSSHLSKSDNGTYTDVLFWTSRDAAQAALDNGHLIPEFVEWSAYTDEIVFFSMLDVVEGTACLNHH